MNTEEIKQLQMLLLSSNTDGCGVAFQLMRGLNSSEEQYYEILVDSIVQTLKIISSSKEKCLKYEQSLFPHLKTLSKELQYRLAAKTLLWIYTNIGTYFDSSSDGLNASELFYNWPIIDELHELYCFPNFMASSEIHFDIHYHWDSIHYATLPSSGTLSFKNPQNFNYILPLLKEETKKDYAFRFVLLIGYFDYNSRYFFGIPQESETLTGEWLSVAFGSMLTEFEDSAPIENLDVLLKKHLLYGFEKGKNCQAIPFILDYLNKFNLYPALQSELHYWYLSATNKKAAWEIVRKINWA